MDPAHMLKLCRNAFATYRQLKSHSGTVDYRYIEDLINYQSEIGLKFANKVGHHTLCKFVRNTEFLVFLHVQIACDTL